jgi:drug/metabolite transporter (DMT)-like permease
MVTPNVRIGGIIMGKHVWSAWIGAAMIVAGLVLFFIFREVETPVIGLRQLGLVLAVLGLIELAVSGFALSRSRRQ